ncbi:head decoration protein [Carnimonas bestiolae]|uniref:head decoration protein n=1 Tax=Carnimonas bestiolae TaxID=3402172 RepID=UPI003EDC1E40
MKTHRAVEPQWAGEHILSEASGKRSVEEIPLATGSTYAAASVVVRGPNDALWRAITADDLGATEAPKQKAAAAAPAEDGKDQDAGKDGSDGKSDSGSSNDSGSDDSQATAPTAIAFAVLYAPVDGVDVNTVKGLAHVRDAELAADLLHWFDGASDLQIALGESYLAKAGLIARR